MPAYLLHRVVYVTSSPQLQLDFSFSIAQVGVLRHFYCISGGHSALLLLSESDIHDILHIIKRELGYNREWRRISSRKVCGDN